MRLVINDVYSAGGRSAVGPKVASEEHFEMVMRLFNELHSTLASQRKLLRRLEIGFMDDVDGDGVRVTIILGLKSGGCEVERKIEFCREIGWLEHNQTGLVAEIVREIRSGKGILENECSSAVEVLQNT
ncbi:MAG: hypothetical protein Q8R25_03145 [bacterium]|nr:hypothetical protein [bacterium]